MKLCKDCNENKPLSEFHKWKYGKDGYKQYCKPCRSIRESKYYNKEKHSAVSAKYYQDNIDRERVKRARYRKENKDVVRACHKSWYEQNKAIKLEQNRLWYKNNPEKRKKLQRDKARRRRAKARALKENFKCESIVFSVFDNKCFICQTDKDLTADHHNPLSKGFVLSAENCVVLCRSCNSKKGTKNPDDFYNSGQLQVLVSKFKQVVEMINEH